LWKELLVFGSRNIYRDLNFCLEGRKLEAGRKEVLEVEKINNDLTII